MMKKFLNKINERTKQKEHTYIKILRNKVNGKLTLYNNLKFKYPVTITAEILKTSKFNLNI